MRRRLTGESVFTGGRHGPACYTPRSRLPREFRGAIAQLGERLNGIQKVRGSSPRSSTNVRDRDAVAPPSSFSAPARSDRLRRLPQSPLAGSGEGFDVF